MVVADGLSKIDFLATNRPRILQLARNKAKLAKYPYKDEPSVERRYRGRIILRIPFR